MINKMDVPSGLQQSAARQQKERGKDDPQVGGDELASDDQHLVGQDNILFFVFFACFSCFFLFVVWTMVQEKKIVVLW